MHTLTALLLTTTTTTLHHPGTLTPRASTPCSNQQLTCPLNNTTTTTNTTSCTTYSSTGAAYLVTCEADFYGGDLDLVQTASLEKCLDKCSGEPDGRCIGVSYKGENCYLKEEIVGGGGGVDGFGLKEQYPFVDSCPLAEVDAYCPNHKNTTGNSGCYDTTENTLGYVVNCGRDFYGADIALQSLPDLSTCILVCQGLGKEYCAGVSWAQREGWGVCYLKEKLKAGIRDEGIIGVVIA